MVQQLEGSGRGKVEAAAWDNELKLWQLQGSLRAPAAAAAGGLSQPVALGTFKALVMADSLTGLPDSAGYVKLHGVDPTVDNAVRRIQEAVSDPVFTLMVAFDTPLAIPFDGATVRRSLDKSQCWVGITTPDYAQELLQEFPLHVQGQYNPQTKSYLEGLTTVLYQQFQRLMEPLTGQALPQPAHLHAQRWGRGFIQRPLGVPCLAAPRQRLVACGDFCLGSSVEDAWLSGRAAADEIAAALLL
ncbi:hypothetical protein N2152v2_010303 [Parachlorella kessleri]